MSAAFKDRRQSRQQAGPQSFEQLLGLDCRLDLGDPLRQLFDARLQVHFPIPISLRLRAFAGAAIDFISRVFNPGMRDRWCVPTPAGMVVVGRVPCLTHHHLLSFAPSLLSPTVLVAENGDSNDWLTRAQKSFARKAKSFCTRCKHV